MKLLIRLGAIFDRVIGIFAFVAAVILVSIWGLLSIEVIIRFLVNYSIPGYIEISEFLLVALTYLGAAWLLRKEGHVRVDIVYTRLKPRAQALLDTIMSTLGIIICLFLVWYGMKVTIDHFQRGILSHDVLQIWLWPLYITIPLGSLLLFIQFCRRAYGNLQLWRMAEGKEAALSQEQPELERKA